MIFFAERQLNLLVYERQAEGKTIGVHEGASGPSADAPGVGLEMVLVSDSFERKIEEKKEGNKKVRKKI